LSIDPVTTDANSGTSFNRYNYAENNPYKYFDPDGRQIVVIITGKKNDPIDPFVSPVPSSRPALSEGEKRVLWAAASNLYNVMFPAVVPLATDLSKIWIGAKGLPPGYMPGDKGGEEWGRRNGVGAKEGRGRFHGIKQGDNMSGPADSYGTNPETGDVVDPTGEHVGNLNDVKPK
jgi:hypothetical protein